MNNVTMVKNAVLAVLAGIGSFLANQFGGMDAIMQLLIGLMVADYITGVALAAIWKKSNKSESGTLSSVAGFKGLTKKGAILLIVWISATLDAVTGAAYIRSAACLFFIGNEGLSLLENVGLMGVPYPTFLKKMLEALREKGECGE